MFSLLFIILACFSPTLFAHGVDDNTKAFLLNNSGVQVIAFMYIGAKHMITGYDHMLFLVGVISFLSKPKEILLYVSLFTLGHSITLLLGVLTTIQLNAYLIDAIIGLSVVYKGFENIGGFKKLLKKPPNTREMVFIFGLFHGFGLATKIQEFSLPQDGLLTNILAFNIGVEFGQFSALIIMVLLINFWRRHPNFTYFSHVTNVILMSAGFMLISLQMTGYFLN